MSKSYIGTSGYAYDHWQKVFYPEEVSRREWLEYYSRFFDSLELNVTFYNLPATPTFEKWNKTVPPNFKFSVKGPRLITHFKKLSKVDGNIDLFYEKLGPLKEKTDIVLWQFQPEWEIDLERLKKFCDHLKKYPFVRYAFEFRNISWFTGPVYELLARLNASIVLCDWPFNIVSESQLAINDIEGKKKIIIPDTANFIYLRRHGSSALYSSLYDDAELQNDADSITNWLSQDSDVYAYFNNDAQGSAVKNAMELKELVKEK